MIQRIQSLFLLLASVATFLEFVFPFFKGKQSATGFFADSSYNIQDHPALLGLTIAAGGLALLTIFLFNNRSLQQKMVYLTMLLSVALLAVTFVLGFQDSPNLFDTASVFVGTFLPIVAIIFLGISLKGINKDDKLVKSMDRLR
jgi:branched-subunit amino acid transport protein AzlD